MDYSWGTDLVKHQWDAIHAPGLVIGLFERDEDAMMSAIDSKDNNYVFDFFRLLRIHIQQNIPLSYTNSFTNKYSEAQALFFSTKMKGKVWLKLENVQEARNLTFTLEETQKTYDRFIINCGILGKIICENKNDRDIIFNFINGDNKLFDGSQVFINDHQYTYTIMYNDLERIKTNLYRSGTYNTLNKNQKLILELPLLMWSMNYKYAGIFIYNWLIEGGDIEMDDKLFAFLEQWELLRNRRREYNDFIGRNRNRRIEQVVSIGDNLRLYTLRDARQFIANNRQMNDLIISSIVDSLSNYSRFSIIRNELLDNINDPHVTAFGTFSVAYNFEGRYDSINHQIIINKVFEVISDGFDFVGSQPLGAWQNSIFAPYKPIEKYNMFDSNILNIDNGTFRDFRTKTNIGIDYRIRGRREVNRNIQIIRIHENGVEYQ
jgi:hypothetical protein